MNYIEVIPLHHLRLMQLELCCACILTIRLDWLVGVVYRHTGYYVMLAKLFMLFIRQIEGVI